MRAKNTNAINRPVVIGRHHLIHEFELLLETPSVGSFLPGAKFGESLMR